MRNLLLWLFHDKLGWHSPMPNTGFDGLSFTGICKHCGLRILQDSQGGWFVASMQEPRA